MRMLTIFYFLMSHMQREHFTFYKFINFSPPQARRLIHLIIYTLFLFHIFGIWKRRDRTSWIR